MYHQAGLQHKQILLKKVADTSINLFAATAASHYAASREVSQKSLSKELAEFFLYDTQENIHPTSSLAQSIFTKYDSKVYKIVKRILNGEAEWLEDGIIKNLNNRSS